MHIVPTILPATTVARIVEHVAKLSDPPSPSTVRVLESYANTAKSFLETNIDAASLKPFLDAIEKKIDRFGVTRTKWAVEFVGALALYTQHHGTGKLPHGKMARMSHPERAARASAN